jgi:hypothetical protein
MSMVFEDIESFLAGGKGNPEKQMAVLVGNSDPTSIESYYSCQLIFFGCLL